MYTEGPLIVRISASNACERMQEMAQKKLRRSVPDAVALRSHSN